MSSRYTTSKKGRTHGAYRRRLEKQGLNNAPRMPTLRSLRSNAKLSTDDLPKND